MVRCAAFAAWTRPGLAMTDKRCFKLTCLNQVRVLLRLHKQVLAASDTRIDDPSMLLCVVPDSWTDDHTYMLSTVRDHHPSHTWRILGGAGLVVTASIHDNSGAA